MTSDLTCAEGIRYAFGYADHLHDIPRDTGSAAITDDSYAFDIFRSDRLSEDDLFFLRNGIYIKSAYSFFSSADKQAFENLVSRLSSPHHDAERLNLIYYITLFRKEPYLNDLLRCADLPLDFIEEIVISIVTRKNFRFDEDNRALDEILDIFPQQTLFDLITAGKYTPDNSMLVFYILSKMETFYLDRYFGELTTVKEFVIEICHMPEKVIRTYFYRNPKLHGYYTMLLNAIDLSDIPNAKEFCSFDLTELDKVKKIAVDISFKFDIKKEKSLSLSRRNTDRFAFIINRIRNLADIPHVLSTLEHEGVIDDEEISLLSEILHNPLFKDVLDKYSVFNDTLDFKESNYLF
ncbi:MAG TPA: hypothetical protein PKK43_00870 [Spirochaetota bacterium]|nr:hypothetical protein [Spirochaetota bacterium]